MGWGEGSRKKTKYNCSRTLDANTWFCQSGSRRWRRDGPPSAGPRPGRGGACPPWPVPRHTQVKTQAKETKPRGWKLRTAAQWPQDSPYL